MVQVIQLLLVIVFVIQEFVNDYILDKKIVCCSIGISNLSQNNIISVLEDLTSLIMGTQYIHNVLQLCDKGFDNDDEKGLLIEYGNYDQELETIFIIDEKDGNK